MLNAFLGDSVDDLLKEYCTGSDKYGGILRISMKHFKIIFEEIFEESMEVFLVNSRGNSVAINGKFSKELLWEICGRFFVRNSWMTF